MSTQVTIAIIGAVPALVTAVISIVVNNRILGFKIDELSKRVEKHNQIVERTYVLERDVKTAFSRVDELREDIRRIEDKI